MDFAAGLWPPSSRLRKPWFSDSSTEHLRSSSAHCQHKQLHCNIELQATESVIYILKHVTNCESLQHYEQQWAHSREEAKLSTRSLYVLFFLLFCTTNTGMPLHTTLKTIDFTILNDSNYLCCIFPQPLHLSLKQTCKISGTELLVKPDNTRMID